MIVITPSGRLLWVSNETFIDYFVCDKGLVFYAFIAERTKLWNMYG